MLEGTVTYRANWFTWTVPFIIIRSWLHALKWLSMVGGGWLRLQVSYSPWNAPKWPCVSNSPCSGSPVNSSFVTLFLQKYKNEDGFPAPSTGLTGLWKSVQLSKPKFQSNHWRRTKHTMPCSSASVTEGYPGQPGCIAHQKSARTEQSVTGVQWVTWPSDAAFWGGSFDQRFGGRVHYDLGNRGNTKPTDE